VTSAQFFACRDDLRRRNEIAERSDLNGIEFLEVLDGPAVPIEERQRTLFVHFVNDPTPLGLVPENVVVEGGERIRGIHVQDAVVGVDERSGSPEPVLTVELNKPGDFSIYTLRLKPTDESPLPGIDEVLRSVDFSFKVHCETKFDPLHAERSAEPPRVEPALDYLARDYPSLRRLLLDRLAVLVPDWQERNPADEGIALVELFAYLGDQLSYKQDAVSTEGYLGTCRLRASARRHARLVDYAMHDGCNARAWVQVRVEDGTPPFELDKATFYSALPGLPEAMLFDTDEHDRAESGAATVFRLLRPVKLAPEHERIRFYTWGARECVLPKGSVRATLRGALPNLQPGMILVFKEERSPRTGDPDDAELTHRHAVRLIAVEHRTDPVGGQFDDPPTGSAVEVTEIAWDDEDALPFSLCISAEAAEQYGGGFVDDVSVALGNIVLADHGATVELELGHAPEDTLEQVRADGETVMARARFRPRLERGPLTQAAEDDPDLPAAAALRYRPADAVPAIALHDGTSESWEPRLDLLSSTGANKHFAVEVESDGRGRIRFGDGIHGARPVPGRPFTARFRVGNGRAGNVGADTLVHVASTEEGILSATNPLPAAGGVDLETVEEVRQYGPVALRPQTLAGEPGRPDGHTLQRAVTTADYAAVTEAHPEVQRATATVRWTGSWRTVSVTADRLGGRTVDVPFEKRVRSHLERFRMAGHDLEIDPPRMVALEIAMHVRVQPGYFADQVREALLDVLSTRVMPDGRRGVFHPDRLTFGQAVYLSPLYAEAQAVDGVESVDITSFQRRDQPGTAALDAGRILLNRLEIARLDNDPNFPEHGTLTLTLEGGR
jgi:hypothetical protein